MRRPEGGSAAVELALVIPVVLAVLLAVVEVAVIARTQLEVVSAAREGAREAAAAPDPGRAMTVARNALGGKGPGARITVRRPDVVGSAATVEVVVAHRVAGSIFGGVTVDLRGRASMRVER